ncbi:MAG: GatB/YqeY domain-containing protein [Desulfobacteraceae bacterium]|jgi:uncharacterized protein YqeY
MLYNELKQDLKESMKIKNMERVNALRVIMGEFPRLNKLAGELPTDDEVLKILKSLKKNEELVLEKSNKTDSIYLNVIEGYLPKMMSGEEIKVFILSSGINVNSGENTGQLTGKVMKDLKGKAEGSLVKEVLTEMMNSRVGAGQGN